jgi:intracellular septation protein
MSLLRRIYPFNAEQTVNILSEFGPLVTMFVVNAMYGISAGTWALIVTTVLAMVVMRIVLHRLPVFPLIASSVTITFGFLTLVTGDPMWVQIKVTIFNMMFALFLFGGLWLNRNFFQYVFEKTFHYTKQGWDRFTFSFAWFFVLTAVLNEIVRLTFKDAQIYTLLGHEMNGVNVWILFKIAFIMPMSAIYAWWLTRLMQKYRVPADASTYGKVHHKQLHPGGRTDLYVF